MIGGGAGKNALGIMVLFDIECNISSHVHYYSHSMESILLLYEMRRLLWVMFVNAYLNWSLINSKTFLSVDECVAVFNNIFILPQ